MISAKYPRTFHMPFSLGATSDDKKLLTMECFLGQEIVISEKLDGSNICMTREHLYARSHLDTPRHPSFDLAKSLHAKIKHLIPDGISIFGEWCYAVHSIKYEQLPSPFFIFAIRDDRNMTWKSWDEVVEISKRLKQSHVPIICLAIISNAIKMRQIIEQWALRPSIFGGEKEGVVIRIRHEFHNDLFSLNVAKWVRYNHVQTDDHWAHKLIQKQNIQTLQATSNQ